jgi:uncharacterized protein DUF1844
VTDTGIKVTDKRMFTADGRLREEYQSIEDAAPAEPEPPAARPSEPPPPPAPAPPEAAAPPGDPRSPRLEIPDLGPGLPPPSFLDLVAMLAEPASIYLGDLPLPDGQTAENLEMARLHIDLLATLRQKTAGNLTAQELGFLEDVLYRLRLRYVQKRG